MVTSTAHLHGITLRSPARGQTSRAPHAIGLMLTGKMYKRHFEHAVGDADILVAHHHFSRNIAGPMTIIWGRLRAHWAGIAQEYIAAHPEIEVEWRLLYAPDLNPEQGCLATSNHIPGMRLLRIPLRSKSTWVGGLRVSADVPSPYWDALAMQDFMPTKFGATQDPAEGAKTHAASFDNATFPLTMCRRAIFRFGRGCG